MTRWTAALPLFVLTLVSWRALSVVSRRWPVYQTRPNRRRSSKLVLGQLARADSIMVCGACRPVSQNRRLWRSNVVWMLWTSELLLHEEVRAKVLFQMDFHLFNLKFLLGLSQRLTCNFHFLFCRVNLCGLYCIGNSFSDKLTRFSKRSWLALGVASFIFKSFLTRMSRYNVLCFAV